MVAVVWMEATLVHFQKGGSQDSVVSEYQIFESIYVCRLSGSQRLASRSSRLYRILMLSASGFSEIHAAFATSLRPGSLAIVSRWGLMTRAFCQG